VIPVPIPGLKLVYGKQLVEEVLLASQRVIPAALERSGYRFAHGTVGEALAAAVG
jgi:NAD dependent epimerase/dehydratase family enzyme